MVWKGDADGRLAKSLIALIDQVDSQWPKRNRRNDGTIGDKRHQAGSSDHNIGSERNETPGVVTALDITDDPKSGCDAMKIAEALRLAEDSRVEYVIHKGRIYNSRTWQWRDRGKGPSDHAEHVHISVMPQKALYDDVRPWPIAFGKPPPPDPGVLFQVAGRMSTFGGPKDTGMAPLEGLALFADEAQMRKYGIGDYLLPGSLGLGRRLDPDKLYVAARWPRELYETLRKQSVLVEANGKKIEMRAVDWGPALWTNRVADLSPGGARVLGLDTDDRCTVTLRRSK